MEIDVTAFLDANDPCEFSASAAELGADAGRITWNNALAEALRAPLLATPDQFDELRAYAAGFGAWTRDEIAAWADTECNAFLMQDIASHARRMDDGEETGTLYRGDDGRMYFYLGA